MKKPYLGWEVGLKSVFGGRESGRESFNIRGKVGEKVWESPVSGDESKQRSNLNINSFACRRLLGCWRYV